MRKENVRVLIYDYLSHDSIMYVYNLIFQYNWYWKKRYYFVI